MRRSSVTVNPSRQQLVALSIGERRRIVEGPARIVGARWLVQPGPESRHHAGYSVDLMLVRDDVDEPVARLIVPARGVPHHDETERFALDGPIYVAADESIVLTVSGTLPPCALSIETEIEER